MFPHADTISRSRLVGLSPYAAFGSSVRRPVPSTKGSHEARLLAMYSVPVIFAADQLAIVTDGGRSGSASKVTSFHNRARRSSRPITVIPEKPRTRRSPAFSADHGSRSQFRLVCGVEASYLPAVTVAQATPRLTSGALWITRPCSARIDAARARELAERSRDQSRVPHRRCSRDDTEAPCYGTSAVQRQVSAERFRR